MYLDILGRVALLRLQLQGLRLLGFQYLRPDHVRRAVAVHSQGSLRQGDTHQFSGALVIGDLDGRVPVLRVAVVEVWVHVLRAHAMQPDRVEKSAPERYRGLCLDRVSGIERQRYLKVDPAVEGVGAVYLPPVRCAGVAGVGIAVSARANAAWCGDIEATNINMVTGWVHAYAVVGSGMIIYNGLDIDYMGSASAPGTSGFENVVKIWWLELKQPWGADYNLPCLEQIALEAVGGTILGAPAALYLIVGVAAIIALGAALVLLTRKSLRTMPK